MNKYFFTLNLGELDEHFWQIIPQHRDKVNDLLEDEKIETYGVNIDRSKAWVVVNAETEGEAIDIIESLPIHDYFSYEVEQLFIFDNALGLMPKMVLN